MRRLFILSGTLLFVLFIAYNVWEAFPTLLHRLLPNRYRVGTNLQTSTLRYTLEEGSGGNNSTFEPCVQNCSWDSYLSNEEFKARVHYTAPFDIYDDRAVTVLRKQVACVPFNFGFDVEKGKTIFPPREYPSCQSQVEVTQPTFHLDHKNQRLSMNCSNGARGTYVLNPEEVAQTDQYLYSQLEPYWKEARYDGSPLLNVTSEYAFGSCGKEYSQAQFIPKFNETVFRRAKSIMLNQTNGKPVRPMIILFLTVDSYSRHHFYRTMKETVRLFNSLNEDGQFTVFDFKVHSTMGQGSPENMVPMFTNASASEFDWPPEEDVLGEFALWSLFKKLGYVTLLGFENCDPHFPKYLGQKMNVDHFIRSFYCGAEKFFKVSTKISAQGQRCIGSHMSHVYSLNYTQSFSQLYQGVNQFIYLHINTAHEETGQHAVTLDPDLTSFLQTYLSTFDAQNDLAVFIQADHGMRYGDWHKDIEAAQEQMLPALFFLSQSRLLDRFPHAYDALWHNTFRLVSKLDFRATILALSMLPYNETYPVHAEEYLNHAKVLFDEKVEDSRVCDDIGIPPWCCACLNAEEIPKEIIYSCGFGEFPSLLTKVAEESLRLINQFAYTATAAPAGLICKELTFDFITKAYGYHLDRKFEQLQIEFTVKEQESVRFEIVALVGSDENQRLFERRKDSYPLEPFVYLGNQVYIRVSDM